MKKILVTGGAGFIGSNFVKYMLDNHKDYKISNLDLLTYAGNLENLKEIENHPNYTFVKGDICDQSLINKLVSDGVNYIINFAAESHVDRSIEDPSAFIRTNIMGTQVLLDTALKNNIEKFVQVSTDEVYGSLGQTGYFTEETPLAPNSPYSASKTSADLLVRAYYETYNLPVNITRCSNNYGPYQFPEKLIPLMVSNALEDKPLPVYGNGLNVRDWLHVKDHCSAIDVVLGEAKPGEVYNIGGNYERTNIEIVKAILRHLDKPESLITYVKDRPGHDLRYAIDSTKIKEDLGWEPKYTFEQGIKETINWYCSNTEWWQKIKSGEYRNYYNRMYKQC
ncbi:MAG: dTDP-glucose 4,6-dehydratase [Firmicutes bacterium]|nr:dTDP-glucose 4,6-dehydratase [Bacillota bacterium]